MYKYHIVGKFGSINFGESLTKINILGALILANHSPKLTYWQTLNLASLTHAHFAIIRWGFAPNSHGKCSRYTVHIHIVRFQYRSNTSYMYNAHVCFMCCKFTRLLLRECTSASAYMLSLPRVHHLKKLLKLHVHVLVWTCLYHIPMCLGLETRDKCFVACAL